jgi:hypothetical protein
MIHMNMNSLFIIDEKRNQSGPEERNESTEHLGGSVNPFIHLTTQSKTRYIMEVRMIGTTLVVPVVKTPQIEGACMAVNYQIDSPV